MCHPVVLIKWHFIDQLLGLRSCELNAPSIIIHPSLVDGADLAPLLFAVHVLADLLDHPEVGLGRHLCAEVAVEGRGVAALGGNSIGLKNLQKIGPKNCPRVGL